MDRIERHDFVNAVLLAVVLLGMAFALVWMTRSLFDSFDDEGPITAEKAPEETTTTTAADATTTTTAPPEETTTTLAARPPDQVTVRVGNGSGKSGVAGRGTAALANAGYPTLSAKNSSVSLAASTVYYLEGYRTDAEVVANLLGIPITNIAPMPPDPGVEVDTANLIIILGADTTV